MQNPKQSFNDPAGLVGGKQFGFGTFQVVGHKVFVAVFDDYYFKTVKDCSVGCPVSGRTKLANLYSVEYPISL